GSSDPQPRREPASTWVDLIDVCRVEIGDPDGAEGESETDRVRLVEPARQHSRAGVDSTNRVGAATARRPDATLVGDKKCAGCVWKLHRRDHLARRRIDAHEPGRVRARNPERTV